MFRRENDSKLVADWIAGGLAFTAPVNTTHWKL